MLEREIFTAALGHAAPGDRARYLAGACDGDPALKSRVERLLALHETDAPLFGWEPVAILKKLTDHGAADAGPARPPAADRAKAGTVVGGRYRLVEKIGEGGVGEVWVAEQAEPIARQVALKLIRAGMDSRTVLARFEQERAVLSRMEHPHIAQALDGGLTADGQPFLVMEYVRGSRLAAFCAEENLSLRARLGLFLLVCHAVQHAHQKGIIHRDLTPANILVTRVDGRPAPKIIDFGIAKVVKGAGLGLGAATQTGFFLGTLGYMSPEQTDRAGDDIDTRTDVYSLGVVLYELLTGLRPFDTEQLRTASLAALVRTIQDVAPVKPSARLLADPAGAAGPGHAEARKRAASLRGELDWVVMKCLEKDRGRRYESAAALAHDIERFLADEPVEARPASAAYRFKKFVRRHTWPVTAAAVAVLALVGGVVGTTVGLVRAERARTAEHAANEKAQKRLRQLESATAILASVFDTLDPDVAADLQAVPAALAENLTKAVEQLEGDATGDPVAVAELQMKLATALFGLEEFRKAAAVLEKAVATFRAHDGPGHVRTLTATLYLASAMDGYRDTAAALALFRRTMPELEAAPAAPPRTVLLHKRCFGTCLIEARQFAEAQAVLEDVLARQTALFGRADPDVTVTINQLALTFHEAGRLDRSIPLYEEGLALYKSRPTATGRGTMSMTNNLASAYSDAGQYDKALALHQQSQETCIARYGQDHQLSLISTNNIALLYRRQKRYDQARDLFEDAARRAERKLGRDDRVTQNIRANLGIVYKELGRLKDALPLLEEANAAAKMHPKLDFAGKHLHECYVRLGMTAQAAKLAKDRNISPLDTLKFTLDQSFIKPFAPRKGQ